MGFSPASGKKQWEPLIPFPTHTRTHIHMHAHMHTETSRNYINKEKEEEKKLVKATQQNVKCSPLHMISANFICIPHFFYHLTLFKDASFPFLWRAEMLISLFAGLSGKSLLPGLWARWPVCPWAIAQGLVISSSLAEITRATAGTHHIRCRQGQPT